GVPQYDPLSARIGESHVFIAGAANVDVPRLHEAADEGRLAGENAARFPHAYRRACSVGLGVVFSDPQIGMAGETYKTLQSRGADFATGAAAFV
ncbi:MAG: dihydrolipoyl dehydrogenase, partial [Pseudomonadota bacterium]